MKSFGNLHIYRYEILLVLILLSGLYLRVDNLGRESLWMDEAYSLMFSRESIPDIIKTNSSTIECISNPPLYYVLLHFFIKMFGESEAALRAASVIFGILSIFLIYKIGEILFNKNVGLISALILALSEFHIYYSQEARSYSLQVLLILISFYFFIRFLQTGKTKHSIGIIAANILLIYTHHYGIFVILSQNLIFLLMYSSTREKINCSFKKWVILQAVIVILFVPWIMVILNILMSGQSGKVWFTPPVNWLVFTLREYSGSFLLMIFFILLSLYALFSILRNKAGNEKNTASKIFWKNHFSRNSSLYFLLIWLLVPVLLPFIVSRVSRPIFLIRYTIAASLPFYLLAAAGIYSIKRRSVLYTVLSAVIILMIINITDYQSRIYKDKWREVAGFVDRNSKPGDLIIFSSGDNSLVSFVFNYYSMRTDIKQKYFPETTKWIPMEELITQLQPAVSGYSRVWVLIYRDRDPREMIKKKLSEDYSLVYEQLYIGGTPILFDSGNIILLMFDKSMQRDHLRKDQEVYALDKGI